MRKTSIFAAAIGMVALPATAFAQAQTMPPAATPPPAAANPVTDDGELINRAGLIFGLFSQAVRTDEIPEDEKSALVGCMYENNLKTISQETGRVLAENPEVDATQPQNVYLIAATVCGARAPSQPATDTPDAPPATPQEPAPDSR